MEEWRLIRDYPLYEVSNLGHVRSKPWEYVRPHPRGAGTQTISAGGKLIKGWTKFMRGKPSAQIVLLSVPVRRKIPLHQSILALLIQGEN